MLNIHWKGWCWSWNSNNLATWCEELTHWKRPWCWERLKAGGKGDGRRWDGWMVSLTQWTWVWANFRCWWWTKKPGMLQSIGLGLENSYTWLSHWTRTTIPAAICLLWKEWPEVEPKWRWKHRNLWNQILIPCDCYYFIIRHILSEKVYIVNVSQ